MLGKGIEGAACSWPSPATLLVKLAKLGQRSQMSFVIQVLFLGPGQNTYICKCKAMKSPGPRLRQVGCLFRCKLSDRPMIAGMDCTGLCIVNEGSSEAKHCSACLVALAPDNIDLVALSYRHLY